MKIAFDFEFYEDGRTIQPISIGMVKETGEELYREYKLPHIPKHHWLHENVLPHLTGDVHPIESIKADILDFCGSHPEFVGWYCSYDFVLLMQHWGSFEQQQQSYAIRNWPFFPIELRLFTNHIPREGIAHNSLDDARNIMAGWVQSGYKSRATAISV